MDLAPGSSTSGLLLRNLIQVTTIIWIYLVNNMDLKYSNSEVFSKEQKLSSRRTKAQMYK